jgi:AcrR family transcriptional regulator
MGRRHDEHELLAAAVDAALDDGLTALTFGRLARRVGIADRTLVYYFTDKPTLVARVLEVLAGRLFEQLGAAFGDARQPPSALLRAAYPVVTAGEANRIFALWLEFVGQAAVGVEPQRSMAGPLLDAWVDWLADRIEAPTRARARADAIEMIAVLDGALLLHHLGRPELAAAAITHATRQRR